MASLSLAVLLVLALGSTSQGLSCGDDMIRGVNLGGWLLLEPWITPTIFEEVNVALGDIVVDEYTYAQYVDPAAAAERLDRHWNEFFTKEDLQILVDAGISHIRIPVGYWLVNVQDDEPFPPPPATDEDGQRFYLKRMIMWCEELGLKVLIDLHGAPESQNGFDNSGRRGPVNWYKPDDHTNVERTLVINLELTQLIFGWINEGSISKETIYGMELLNEPAGFFDDIWEECRDNYYYSGYDTVRAIMKDSEVNTLVIQQAFRPHEEFYGYMPEEDGYLGVAMDAHEYHAFGDYWNGLAEVPEGWGIHLDTACGYGQQMAGHTLKAFTGEWSLAITDCQKYLDGGYDNPYVPPNGSEETCAIYNSDFDTYTEEYKQFLTQYMLAQMDGHEKANGWFFWTAKTENNCAPEWDFMYLLEKGIAPANLCERDTFCA